MKKRNHLSIFFAVIYVGLLLNNITPIFCRAKQDTPRPIIIQPLKVDGYALLVTKNGSQHYNNRLNLFDRDDNPVSGIICTFENQIMPENCPGGYTMVPHPTGPTSGTLNFSINNPKSPDANPNYYPISASYDLGELVRITGPVSGTHIPLESISRLVISWTGGTLANKFDVQIFEYEGDIEGAKMFDQRSISLRRVSISPYRFRTGKKYEIVITHTHGQFTLTGRTYAGSAIHMYQSTKSSFFID
jgi:hypothetical protein